MAQPTSASSTARPSVGRADPAFAAAAAPSGPLAQGREFVWTNADFARVQALIYQRAGISLHDGKHAMVYSRLSRRLRDTGQAAFTTIWDGWSGEDKEEALERQLIPFFSGIKERLKEPGMNEMDCGQGIAQATLMAFEQGLGRCLLGGGNTEKMKQNLGLPESARILILQTVGYPAESPDAGGQRPRQTFESLFHMNGYGNPFPRCAEVVSELTDDGMIQTPAPAAWPEAELEYLRNALGIKGNGLICGVAA